MSNCVMGSFTDPRDKKVYKTVKIGSQVWLAENLAYNATGSRYYKDEPAKYAIYGKLYDLHTAINNACPPGWHLPTDAEWQTLVAYAGGSYIAGKRLKARSGWKYYKGISSTDNFCFTALPGGFLNSVGTFRYDGRDGRWWSNSEGDDDKPYAYGMVFHDKGDKVRPLSRDEVKDFFCSIRCVQD